MTTGAVDSTTSSSSGGPGSSSGSTTGSADSTSTTTAGETEGTSTGEEPNFADPRGYTLFAPLNSRFTYLMDADGMEIHSWESDVFPANAAYLLENGHLLRVGRILDSPVELVSGVGGAIQEYDWDGNLVWEYEHASATTIAHHDIERLPNGNVLAIAYEIHTVAEAIQAGRDPDDLDPAGLWADYLVEIDPMTDTIVWEWHVWDHMVQEFDPLVDNFDVVAARPERIDINWVRPGDAPRPDWTHINAVAYNADLDQIVLSPRTFSEIWIIDHSTTTAEAAGSVGGGAGQGGDLLYRWGNPATYQAGGEPERDLYFQHNPRWISAGKPGAGNLLIFDNGDPVLRPYSRVVEVETPVQPDGTYPLVGPIWGPVDPAWSYGDVGGFFASFISGADRLADGRTLVCSGPDGRLFEVTAGGKVPWDITLSSTMFRAERYEFEYPAWIGLTEDDLAPNGPLVIDVSP
ncbi:MAG: aryl-sulfate sulfotransferase [Deltaproteobacteria bacterium]|nr:aryl-sulfate sulfotransferase [Deltaproteobacteria bacterium]